MSEIWAYGDIQPGRANCINHSKYFYTEH